MFILGISLELKLGIGLRVLTSPLKHILYTCAQGLNSKTIRIRLTYNVLGVRLYTLAICWFNIRFWTLLSMTKVIDKILGKISVG
jgi:hypothetical protein